MLLAKICGASALRGKEYFSNLSITVMAELEHDVILGIEPVSNFLPGVLAQCTDELAAAQEGPR